MTSAEALQSQCTEHYKRCLYTSASLLIWLRVLRIVRIAFIIVPIIFGAVAGWDLLQGQNGTAKVVTATLALLAGLVPRRLRGPKARRAPTESGLADRRI
jgi:hypothetical protein